MGAAEMDLVTAILTRRSEHFLTDPAPSDDEFADLLRAAAAAPDHGMLRPWRWILVRHTERHALGECFAADAGAERPDEPATEVATRVAAKVLRAPLLATLVFQPRLGHRIPEWEQLAATSSMSHALMLLLHARGYGSIWRTGAFVASPTARQMLGLHQDERLLGWLYIGTPPRDRALQPRVVQDVTDRLSSFRLTEVAAARRHP
ncbi:nitroreductase [Plantactinospora solaniradicis]|uniref:Putative NAD(P)H nitroreductase n=1 Tax=Plantactinospora solaniradicis TaxID=1723736 RepID=A0ABW1K3Z4_9ACTN